MQGSDGNFYGTTIAGGAQGNGTVFKITPTGTLTTLYNFCYESSCPQYPQAALVQGSDGNFYGTTPVGGTTYNGTVYEITPSGALTTLYNFCSQTNCTDGSKPYAGLVQATDGDFYGTTIAGGAQGNGTIFKITPSGTLTTLYSFCSQSGCDYGLAEAGLIQATDGNFYGTTDLGAGTVFTITPSGTFTTLYSFCSDPNCADGTSPLAALVQATNGNFYGTTSEGGASDNCPGGCGTVFTAAGAAARERVRVWAM